MLDEEDSRYDVKYTHSVIPGTAAVHTLIGRALLAPKHDSISNTNANIYLPHSEPMESELAKQVEYDMDEQGTSFSFVSRAVMLNRTNDYSEDQLWLEAVNSDRRRDGIPQFLTKSSRSSLIS